MAARYYGISRGEAYVSEGSSTTSKEIEVVVAVTGTVTKDDAQVLLETIKQHIRTQTDNLEA